MVLAVVDDNQLFTIDDVPVPAVVRRVFPPYCQWHPIEKIFPVVEVVIESPDMSQELNKTLFTAMVDADAVAEREKIQNSKSIGHVVTANKRLVDELRK